MIPPTPLTVPAAVENVVAAVLDYARCRAAADRFDAEGGAAC